MDYTTGRVKPSRESTAEAMARTRSDSGLSSARLGVTSHRVSQGGQLATSTPLKTASGTGLRPTPGLKGRSTPLGAAPGLEAALQESARVRRRLAEELAREAAGASAGCGVMEMEVVLCDYETDVKERDVLIIWMLSLYAGVT